jgi:hydroxymethylbilane synthase
LAVTTREGDATALAALARVEDPVTRLEITAERAFLAALDGSCRTPIAALARWADGEMSFIGESLSPDGVQRWRRATTAPCATPTEAHTLGARLGDSLLREAGDALYRA